MRKLLTRLLVFLLAVTSVFGLTGLKSVKADKVAVEGVEIIGASVRNNKANENDLTGIRFTTTVSQEAYDAIIREAGENEVQFGTEITDNDLGHKIQDFCYVSTVEGGEGIVQVAKGAFEYYASITFNDEDFAKDVLKKLRGLEATDEVNLETATAEETAKISAYKALAYAELLKATSYYKIDGVKYYTKSLVRSMRMVANYYDKNQKEFGKLPDEFYNKNYFVAGVERFGYLKENGEVVADNVNVKSITGVSYKAQPVEFELVDGALKLKNTAFVEEELSKTATLYAFDKDNRVTVLNLKYVTDVITTGEQLTMFNVGYTFDATEYEKAPDKEAYLKEKQDNPFDYYEGYYVLANDVDVTNVAFQHEAVQYVSKSHAKVGFLFDDKTNSYVSERNGRLPNDNAHDYDGDGDITELEEKYYVPRYGYPMISNGSFDDNGGEDLPTLSFYYKIGFRGTFDGQGHVITGVNATNRTTPKYYADYSVTDANKVTTNYTNSLTAPTTFKAGIFGVTSGGSVLKNFAIKDQWLDFGSALMFIDAAPVSIVTETPASHQADVNDAFPIKEGASLKTTIENVYVANKQYKDETNVRGWGGIFRYNYGGANPIYKNFVVNYVNVSTSNSDKGEYPSQFCSFIGGSNVHTYNENNNGFSGYYENVYIAVAVHGNKIGTTKDFDVTTALTMAELFEKTTNGYGTEKTMAGSFANNKYWTVVGKEVYWKGIYEKSLALSATSVELADKNATAEVTLYHSGTEVEPTVTLDSNILAYNNGVISVVNHVPGTYEVVFNYNGAEVVLEVVLSAVPKNAYLQEDGELVSHGLDSIVGKYFTVNGTVVDATMFNGKIKLDIADLGLTAPTTQAGSAIVEMYGDFGKEITFNCKYVSLAIDEAKDLEFFSVDYTFNDAVYNAMPATTEEEIAAKIAYLENCQANPFDNHNGYYVLTKNIDATGVELRHEAVIYTGTTSTGIGVIANENTNTFEEVHPDAGIEFGGNTYVFPRPGYPLVGMKYVADWTTGTETFVKGFPVVLFANIGLTGTFDGQGNSITNLSTVRKTPVTYKVSGSDDKSILQGSGLFGIVRKHTVIKNVGLEINADGGASGIALYSIATWKAKTWTVSATDSRDLPDAEPFNTDTVNALDYRRGLFENVYIKNLGTDATSPNGFIFNYWFEAKMAFNNVLIDTNLSWEYGLFNDGNIASGQKVGYMYGTVGARDVKANNLFITSTRKDPHWTTSGNNTFDLTWSTSLESLLNGTVTTNTFGKASSIYELSDTAPAYWLAVDTNNDGVNDKLYWRTLAPSAE